MSLRALSPKARALAIGPHVWLVAILLSTGRAIAQRPTGTQLETRADAIVSRTTSIQAGLGISTVAGVYVRPYVILGAGATTHDGEWTPAGRVDIAARFHTDPFRESKWAPYGAGGLSARFERGDHARGLLLIALGVEGPVRGGWVPAFEVGLGGGARVGLGLRRARGRSR